MTGLGLCPPADRIAKVCTCGKVCVEGLDSCR